MLRLSVIVPVFNTAPYLKQCLDSICAQTLKDLEIICVDDSSTDGSSDILAEYAAADPRFKIIHSRFRQGPSGSRNTGMKAACGEYIGFVDSDDWVAPDYFESLVCHADLHHTDILLNTNFVREHIDRTEPGAWMTYVRKSVEGERLTPEFSANFTHSLVYLHLYRRRFIIENRLNFPYGYDVHEDDFFHKVSSLCAKEIYAYYGSTYHYRHRNGSLMESRTLKNEPYVRMFTALKEFYGARILDPSFKLKLYSSPLFSEISCEEEFQGLKDYLLGLHDYFEQSGVEMSDYDHFAIDNILRSENYEDCIKRISAHPWLRYHTLERARMKASGRPVIEVRVRKGDEDALESARQMSIEDNRIQIVMVDSVRLSVIVPVYNTASFLPQCLHSLQSQSVEDAEFICVDDCSTDESLDILNDFAAKDPRFKVISLDHNSGPSAARNAGLKAAQGEYAGFVDSDDWVDCDYFSSMLSIALEKSREDKPLDILLNTSANNEHSYGGEPLVWMTYQRGSREGEWLTPEFSANFTHCQLYLHLYRRQFLLDNALTLPEELSVHEDVVFHRLSSSLAGSIYAYSGPVYHYRCRAAGLMGTRQRSNELAVKAFCVLRDKFGDSIQDPSFKIKLFNRLVFSELSDDAEFNGLKKYLLSLEGYFRNSGVVLTDFERFCVEGVLASSSCAECLKKLGSDPWIKYNTFERIRMGTKVKVSVIIPFYNTEEYIDRCLESVCSQSVRELEIICVNDGSSDSSLKHLQQASIEDVRVKVLDFGHNRGVSAARNAALDIAKGKYVYFLDSDDWIDRKHIESLVSEMEKIDSPVLVNTSYVNEYDDPSRKEHSSFAFDDGSYVEATSVQNLFPPVIWARLYRRDFIEKNSVRFPQVKGGAEDIFFAYACDLCAGKVFVFKGMAYHYYQRQASAVHQASRGFHYIESFSMLYHFLLERQIPLDGVKLFYVESLVLDTEAKYDFTRNYLMEIKDKVDAAQRLYNAQELFLMQTVLENADYASFRAVHNPNIALAFIRQRMKKQ